MNRVLFGARRASVYVFACVLAVHGFSSALAEESTLAPVVITATRTEISKADVLSDMSVIDRDVIEQAAGLSVSEVLRQYSGLQIASNGGLGKESTVYIRGTEARHVLLLIDGVAYGSATKGAPNWDNLPLAAIERIEVLRGAAASLYGSDAVGGVVQILTRRGEAGETQPYLSATLGSYGRRELSTGITGGSSQVQYSFGLATMGETGISARNVNAGSSYNPDDDGFDQQSVHANFRWQLSPTLALGGNMILSSGENHFDASTYGSTNFNVRGLTTTRTSGLNVSKVWAHGGRTRVQFGRADDLTRNVYRTATTVFDTRREQWSAQHDQPTAVGTVIVGVDNTRDEISGTEAYAVRKRAVDGIYVGLQGRGGAHRWQVNARHDNNSQFGSASTGSLGYGYDFLPSWIIVASLGTSFKAPTFNQLYSPVVSSSFKSNPDLKPEEALNKELGLRYVGKAYQWDATLFSNKIDNLIMNGNPVRNAQKAEISGWSIGGRYAQGDWKVGGYLEVLNARDKTSGIQYNRKLARRADEQLTLSVERAIETWWLGVHALLVSHRLDSAGSDRILPGFGTLSISAERPLGSDWSLQLRVNNLGDKVYETAYSYNQPGRSIYTTLNWRPRR